MNCLRNKLIGSRQGMARFIAWGNASTATLFAWLLKMTQRARAHTHTHTRARAHTLSLRNITVNNYIILLCI